ncbi:CopZ family metallochaperone [Sporomusa acidovorans]|jgi:Copper chaperone|uniref:Copper chaperone CopZ n=1 Tax=Sporomusa acidovorans (strain ATCC 49682 / DSM 3132 / Mol) TaxID=1123286 RepID=A0ABZ3J558_SPOA4|nr:cation transporter [Sporomusa acidovorans]OZC23095.1 copper chaperone CopZ [Sporomusa acidovorans DSM 3132]SDF05301.1 copper chaperone [Sporomusa acidovorans]
MSQATETILKIEGMSCGHCKMSVEKALQAVAGVVSASVDLDKKQAVVVGNAKREALAKAVEDVGFDVVD